MGKASSAKISPGPRLLLDTRTESSSTCSQPHCPSPVRVDGLPRVHGDLAPEPPIRPINEATLFSMCTWRWTVRGLILMLGGPESVSTGNGQA